MQGKINHLTSWATTSRGTRIELYKKTHSSNSEKVRPFLFVGGVHGDEPEGVRLAQDFLAWLTNEEALGNELAPWLLIPCINPDGYSQNNRTNANGVDLNRNFPSKDWSPYIKAPRYNPGPSPGSEQEVQALVQLIEDEKPQLIVHFHSWEPCVVYTGAPGKWAAELIAQDTGYEAREDIGYPTPGSLGQFGWLEHQIPVICVEAQEKSELDTIWPRFQKGLKLLLTRKNGIG